METTMNKISNMQELIAAVHDYAADCHDAIVSTNDIRFQQDSARNLAWKQDVGLFGWQVEDGNLNDYAAYQMVSKLDAPEFRWLFDDRHCPADLASVILNRLVETRPPQQIMIRSKADTVRAILSDQYTKFDNHQLVDLVARAVGTMGIEPDIKRVVVGDDLAAYILFPQVTVAVDPRNGGSKANLHPAMHIRNSERGGGKAKIAPAVFTGVCSNGMIYGLKNEDALSVSHRYISMDTMGVLVADAIAVALKMSADAAQKFVKSVEVKLEPRSLAGIVAGWASQYGLTVGERDDWMNAIVAETNQNERPDEPRLFDVLNGATYLAQSREPALAVNLERMAGAMLQNYFPE
jgi:hypothetical protein